MNFDYLLKQAALHSCVLAFMRVAIQSGVLIGFKK